MFLVTSHHLPLKMLYMTNDTADIDIEVWLAPFDQTAFKLKFSFLHELVHWKSSNRKDRSASECTSLCIFQK